MCSVTYLIVILIYIFTDARGSDLGSLYINGNEYINGTYYYIDGELVEFMFKPKLTENVTLTKIFYIYKGGKEKDLYIDDLNYPHLVKLNKADNIAAIRCHFGVGTRRKPLYDIVVIDIREMTSKDIPRFKVSDLPLRGKNIETETNNIFEYIYQDNEPVDVVSMVDRTVYTGMTCRVEGDNVPSEFNDFKTPQNVSEFHVNAKLKSSHNRISITCEVHVNEPLASDYRNSTIILNLIPYGIKDLEREFGDPIITGFFYSRIIIKSVYIKYMYKVDEEFALNCLSKFGLTFWVTLNTNITSHAIKADDYSELRSFVIKDSDPEEYMEMECWSHGVTRQVIMPMMPQLPTSSAGSTTLDLVTFMFVVVQLAVRLLDF